MSLRVEESPCRFRDRRDAGRQLAQRLEEFTGRDDVLVLALTRNGVAVAYEVARALRVQLDLFLVRKLPVDGHPEVTMGAITSGGGHIHNQVVLDAFHVTPEQFRRVELESRAQLEADECRFRGHTHAPDLTGKTVILVDDGVNTGATLRAAIAGLEQARVAQLVVGVPVAPAMRAAAIRAEVDNLFCAFEAPAFRALADWYDDFTEVTDSAVTRYLEQAQPAAVRIA
jgi:putative phosphoribosyl transferase